MKKIVALSMMFLLALAAFGCGKKEDEVKDEGPSVQEEIVKMINDDLPSISTERDDAGSIYNEFFKEGADIDSETWKDQLKNNALVSYDAYLDKLNALNYDNPEVQNLKDLFVKSSNSQRQAIQCVVDAIEGFDSGKLSEAQQAISDSKTYMSMYEDELKRLCASYNINVSGEYTSDSFGDTSSNASSTDAE